MSYGLLMIDVNYRYQADQLKTNDKDGQNNEKQE